MKRKAIVGEVEDEMRKFLRVGDNRIAGVFVQTHDQVLRYAVSWDAARERLIRLAATAILLVEIGDAENDQTTQAKD